MALAGRAVMVAPAAPIPCQEVIRAAPAVADAAVLKGMVLAEQAKLLRAATAKSVARVVLQAPPGGQAALLVR